MREKEDEQNSSARDGSADPFGKFPRRMDPRFPGMVFLGSVDGLGFILNKLRVRFAEKAKEVVDYLVGRFGGEPSCAEPVRNYSHWLTNKASAAMVLVRLVLSESATATERCAEWDADLGHDSGAFNVFFNVAQAPDAVVLDGEFVRMRKELELEGMLFADEAARILARRRQDRKMAEASVADGVACLVGEKRARAERLAKFGKLGAKTIRETAGMHDPTRVFTGEGEMHNPRFTHREWLRARFLADAIPAESRAAGANAFEIPTITSVRMDSEENDGENAGCMSEKGEWPREEDGTKIWAHSDFKQVAYFFVCKLFDKFAGTEGKNVVK